MNDTLKKIVIAFLLISIETGLGIVLKGEIPEREPKGLELRWEIMLDNDVLECREAGGLVFFSDGFCIYAVDAKTGVEIWNVKSSCPDIDVGYGLVYGMDSDGVARAYNAKTGEEVWSHEIKEKDDNADEYLCRSVRGFPFVSEDVVLFIVDFSAFVVFDALTGRDAQMPDRFYKKIPLISNGLVCFPSEYHCFIKEDTKEERWFFPEFSSHFAFSIYTVPDGTVCFLLKNILYVIDAETGIQRWEIPSEFTMPAVSGGVVYCGYSGGVIRAFDAFTGQKKWEFCTNEKETFCRPVVYEGYVYCGTDKGVLYAIDAQTGAKSAMFKITKGEIASLEISNGFIYFGIQSYPQRVGDYGEVYGVEIVR